MPLYEVNHAISLSDSQQDQLAETLTTLHITQFGALRLFVNVIFNDVSTLNTYIGGKRRKGNHIRASVRLGDRTNEDFRSLCQSIQDAWNRIVYEPMQRERPAPVSELKQYELHTIIIRPSNPVEREAGFDLPGEDWQWLRKHWADFREKARQGEEEFVDLVNEAEERRLLSGLGYSFAFPLGQQPPGGGCNDVWILMS